MVKHPLFGYALFEPQQLIYLWSSSHLVLCSLEDLDVARVGDSLVLVVDKKARTIRHWCCMQRNVKPIVSSFLMMCTMDIDN